VSTRLLTACDGQDLQRPQVDSLGSRKHATRLGRRPHRLEGLHPATALLLAHQRRPDDGRACLESSHAGSLSSPTIARHCSVAVAFKTGRCSPARAKRLMGHDLRASARSRPVRPQRNVTSHFRAELPGKTGTSQVTGYLRPCAAPTRRYSPTASETASWTPTARDCLVRGREQVPDDANPPGGAAPIPRRLRWPHHHDPQTPTPLTCESP